MHALHIRVCQLAFHLPDSHSLKDRRRSVKRFKDRVRNGYNVSVTEHGDLNLWQRAEIAVVAAGTDPGYLDGLLQKVVHDAETQPEMILTDVSFDEAW